MLEKKNEVSSTGRARASQRIVGLTSYVMNIYGFTKEQIDMLNQMPESSIKRRIIGALLKENTQMIQHNGIAIPEHVLNRWEKWPEIWKQINSKIVIDLNDHKIKYWELGLDLPIVMPKRDKVGSLRSWEQKLALFAKETTSKYESTNPANIQDMSPYRSVFCCKPNFECKVEYHNISSEASRDMGIQGTTFTEYNVLDMFVFLEMEKHIDASSVCLCTGSISVQGSAVVAYWRDEPKLSDWDHRNSGDRSSVRQTV